MHFQIAQYSNTPSLRVAGFEDEDDDEDENDAPHEWHQIGARSGRRVTVKSVGRDLRAPLSGRIRLTA